MRGEGSSDSEFPEELFLRLKRANTLRYGENPHQEAALYLSGEARPSVATARKVQGKELSYNNINDADAALDCVSEFTEPACVIVKHMNPCGVAVCQGDTLTLKGAFLRALACDAVSAFGGIVALNRELDAAAAEEMLKIFLEVVVAPTASVEALRIFSSKPNVRILVTGEMPEAAASGLVVRSVSGGFLVQTRDNSVFHGEPKVVTKRVPTDDEMADLKFAFTVAKHVKSNAIVYAKAGATLGVGAGQMSRIYSAKIAALKAQEAGLLLNGSVMASDAFMPFPDCVEAAHEVGATAIIQPGGSLKDQDSIDAADKYDMAMIFSGVRHFRH